MTPPLGAPAPIKSGERRPIKSGICRRPGSTIGVMGSANLGPHVRHRRPSHGLPHSTSSAPSGTPPRPVADLEIAAPYDEQSAVESFARGVDLSP